MHHPTDRIAHTTTFVKSVMEHWLEQEIAQKYGKGPLSDGENPLLSLHGLLFFDLQQGIFYMYYPTDMIAHTAAFVISVLVHWLE